MGTVAEISARRQDKDAAEYARRVVEFGEPAAVLWYGKPQPPSFRRKVERELAKRGMH